jgi:tetratricopeptide (TPR) repeat protein
MAKKKQLPVARRSPGTQSSSRPAPPTVAPAASSAARAPWLTPALAAALFLLTAALYWPSTGHRFVNFDDDIYVTNNPMVRRGLSGETVTWALRSTHASNWHPLTWLSHLADVAIWGVSDTSAYGHHLTNIMLHALTAALVFGVWRSLTGRIWSSALLAALFAWHPLRVESVAWVAERKDLLSGLCWFLTIAAYCYYTRRPDSWGRYALVMISFVLGLMAKPMVVTLPFVLLLLDDWPLGRYASNASGKSGAGTFWPLLREKIPLLALASASAAITFVAQRSGGAVVGAELPFSLRLANAIRSYCVYVWQTFCPLDLAVFYPLRQQALAWPKIALLAAGLVLLSWAALKWRRQLPYFAVGWFWYVGTLVPVIGLIQVGGQSHADRYTYLPSVGLFLIATWGAADLVARWPRLRGAIIALAILILLACLVGTRHQLRYWRDSVTLFERATQVSPHSPLAWINLGGALLEQGRAAEAVDSYRRALEIEPLMPAEAGLATALAATGDIGGSIRILRAQFARNPDDPKLANNLAWVLATQADERYRDPSEAVRLAEFAAQHSGASDPTILDTLAAAYAAAGRFDDAIHAVNQALEQARRRNDPELANSLAERRDLYQARRPYVEPPPAARPTDAVAK